MKILITGGAGFVGTNLIKRLLKDGHKITSIDNYSTGKKENEQEDCVYLDADFSQSIPKHGSWGQAKFEVEKPDIIFHIGALARIQPSFEKPTDSFETNVLGTQYIMDYAREYNLPVVYAGSSSVHGDKHANPYTFTKWLGEEVVIMYNKVYDVKTVICRFYNVYGEYQATEGDYCNVLGIFQRQYNNGEPLTITGDGEQRRDFTYVGDIVDGLIRCGENINDVNGEIFELGSGINYSVNEIANAFGNYDKKYLDERPGEMRETLNTDTKAREVLGWRPNGNIIEFVKENLVK